MNYDDLDKIISSICYTGYRDIDAESTRLAFEKYNKYKQNYLCIK